MLSIADPERLQLSRSGVKLDVSPEGMPSSFREDYLRLIGHSDPAHLEASMRPGCTHIVATALTQVRPHFAVMHLFSHINVRQQWSSINNASTLPH